MPAEIHDITERSHEDDDELLSTVAEIAEAVHRIDHRTAQMEQRLERMFAAWSSGGLKGLRQAARGSTNV
jgi:hypothetical protein